MLTQWVVKLSKFCNLRCEYCYELPELGNRARMAQPQITAMFSNMATFYDQHPAAQVHFVWHGGEPLLQEPTYFRWIFAEQKRLLGGVPCQNFMQTNLTILDDDRLDLLRELDGLGVSIDLFGAHRLNLAGRDSQDRVLRNLDRLRAAKIPFGCITVLTRRNLHKIDQIFRFYESLGLTFRVLPLFRGATGDQNQAFQVTAQEVLDALCRLCDLWLASPTQIPVAPFSQLLPRILARRGSGEPEYYNRRDWEEVVIVNTNGDLYADADAYAPGKAWGNIFDHSLAELFAGAAWERSVRETEARLAAVCTRCEYFGACRGYAVAEDNREYTDELDEGGRARCIVERGLCAHIERRIDEARAAGRLDDRVWHRISPAKPALDIA
jgi:uncharacterized protein